MPCASLIAAGTPERRISSMAMFLYASMYCGVLMFCAAALTAAPISKQIARQYDLICMYMLNLMGLVLKDDPYFLRIISTPSRRLSSSVSARSSATAFWQKAIMALA